MRAKRVVLLAASLALPIRPAFSGGEAKGDSVLTNLSSKTLGRIDSLRREMNAVSDEALSAEKAATWAQALRLATDEARDYCDLPAYDWKEPSARGKVVRAGDINDLRKAVGAFYTLAPAWSDPAAPGATLRVLYFEELVAALARADCP